MIIDPWGEIVAAETAEREAVVTERIRLAKSTVPARSCLVADAPTSTETSIMAPTPDSPDRRGASP